MFGILTKAKSDNANNSFKEDQDERSNQRQILAPATGEQVGEDRENNHMSR